MWALFVFSNFKCLWMLQNTEYLDNLLHINICNMPIDLNVNFQNCQQYTHCLIPFWNFVICRPPPPQPKTKFCHGYTYSIYICLFNPSYSFHSFLVPQYQFPYDKHFLYPNEWYDPCHLIHLLFNSICFTSLHHESETRIINIEAFY